MVPGFPKKDKKDNKGVLDGILIHTHTRKMVPGFPKKDKKDNKGVLDGILIHTPPLPLSRHIHMKTYK